MKSRAKLLAALLAGIFVFSFASVSCSNGSDSSPLAFIPTSPTNPTEPTNGGTGGDNGSGGGTTTNPTNPTNPTNSEQQTQTTFTVTFQTERGTLPDQFKNGITVNENDKLTAEQLPGLAADGFAFGGWLDGETLVVAGEYTVKKNVVLTAKWTVATVSYTVSFASEHGTVPQSVTLPENSILMETNIPTLEEEGWRFDGWFDGDTKIQAGSYTLTKNLSLSAKWTKTYKVTFSSEFGQVPATVVIAEKTLMTEEQLPALEQEGYAFEGWFDGETRVYAGQYSAKTDVTLVAKWEKLCLVSYEAIYGVVPESFYVRKKTQLTYEQVPTIDRENYNFSGWYNGDEKIDSGFRVVSDITLTARWSPKWRIIEYYDSNGTKMSGPSQKLYYSEPESKVTVKDDRSGPGLGYAGWRTDRFSYIVDFPYGKEVSYSDIPSNGLNDSYTGNGALKLYEYIIQKDGEIYIDISAAANLIKNITQIVYSNNAISKFTVHITGKYNDMDMKNITDVLKDLSIQRNQFNLDFADMQEMKSVNDHEFEKCKSVKKIILPEGVKTIGEYAFATDALRVELPDSVNMIKPFAFKQATVNKIPASLTCIGQSAFRLCSSITENLTSNGLEIPNTVRRIDKFAFSNAIYQNRVVIPSSVRYISCRAFAMVTDNDLISIDNPYVVMAAMYGLGTSNWNTEFAKWYTTNSGFDDVESNYKYASGKQITSQWTEKYKKYDYSSITEQELAKHFNGKECFKSETAWFKRE